MDVERFESLGVAARDALGRGDSSRALESIEERLEMSRERFGPEHDRTLREEVFRARALLASGRYAEAAEQLVETLVVRDRTDGLDAESTLRVRNNLARAVALGGQPDQAIVMSATVLDVRLRTHGPDDRTTLSTRGHLAHFHHLAGRSAEAIAMYEALLVDQIRVLGDDDPDAATTEHNLGAIRAELPDVDLGELRHDARALEAERGADDPATQAAYHRLVAQLLRRRNDAEALGLARWLQLVSERNQGAAHRTTLATRRQVARALHGLGPCSDAIAELYEVLATMDGDGSGDDVDALATMADIVEFSALRVIDGALLADDELVELAEVWLRFRAGVEHLSPDHPIVGVVDDYSWLFERATDERDGDERDGDGFDDDGFDDDGFDDDWDPDADLKE